MQGSHEMEAFEAERDYRRQVRPAAPNYEAAAAHNAARVVEYPSYLQRHDVAVGGQLVFTLQAGWSHWSPRPEFFWNAVARDGDTLIRFDGKLPDANFADAWSHAVDALSAEVAKFQH